MQSNRNRRAPRQEQNPHPSEPLPGVEVQPKTTMWPMAAGVVAVLLFSLFIFSNTNGDIGIHGDDVWFMTHSHPFSWNYFAQVGERGYLTPFYSLVFDLNGQSAQRAHLFWFAVLAISGLLFQRLLSKFLGIAAGTVAAMFYIAYAGKHEIVTWLSAGAYLAVSVVLFVCVWIAVESRLPPWGKALLITMITWFGTLICEILIVVAPLYPLFFWLSHRLRKEPTPLRRLLPTFLPLVMFGVHALIIYLNTPHGNRPIWMRGDIQGTPTSLLAALWDSFVGGISVGFGLYHYQFVIREISMFQDFIPMEEWASAAGLLGLIGAFVLTVWRSRGAAVTREQTTLTLLGAAGVYLILVSPMVGFTTNRQFVSSRMLTLSGIGLAVLAGVLVSLALASRQAAVRWLAPLAILTVTGMEGLAMNGILYEHQTSWAYDSSIRSRILSSGIQPHLGDGIYASLPRSPLSPIWLTGISRFDGGDAQPILAMDYGFVVGPYTVPLEQRLLYYGQARSPDRVGMPVTPSQHRSFCFVIRDGDFMAMPANCTQATPASVSTPGGG